MHELRSRIPQNGQGRDLEAPTLNRNPRDDVSEERFLTRRPGQIEIRHQPMDMDHPPKRILMDRRHLTDPLTHPQAGSNSCRPVD